jgi:hypothetical protein
MKRENNYSGLLETGRRQITILAVGKIDKTAPQEPLNPDLRMAAHQD